jgi:hypothetical protein
VDAAPGYSAARFGQEHAPTTGRAGDSFRHPRVVAGRDWIGDEERRLNLAARGRTLVRMTVNNPPGLSPLIKATDEVRKAVGVRSARIEARLGSGNRAA